MALYMHYLYMQGKGCAKIPCSYLRLETDLDGDRQNRLPLSRKALRGFRILDPPRTRDPIPFDAIWLAENANLAAAVLLIFQFDMRAPPSEALRVHVEDFVAAPPGRGFRLQGGADGELGQQRKNGDLDDAARIGSVNKPWVAAVLTQFVAATPPGQPVFGITLKKCAVALAEASAALSVGCLSVCPHNIRHSAPSHDRWHNTLSRDEVMKRRMAVFAQR